MNITKSANSIFLNLSNKEIESIVKNVIFGNSSKKILKTAQTFQMPAASIDYLENWLNKLVKQIWDFNTTINKSNSAAMGYLKNFPEYKGIASLIQKLQDTINSTVNGFVEQVNAYEPQSTTQELPNKAPVQPQPSNQVQGQQPVAQTSTPSTAVPNITKNDEYWIKAIRSNKIKNPAKDIPPASQTTAVMQAWDRFTRGRYKKPNQIRQQPVPVTANKYYTDYLNNKLSSSLMKKLNNHSLPK